MIKMRKCILMIFVTILTIFIGINNTYAAENKSGSYQTYSKDDVTYHYNGANLWAEFKDPATLKIMRVVYTYRSGQYQLTIDENTSNVKLKDGGEVSLTTIANSDVKILRAWTKDEIDDKFGNKTGSDTIKCEKIPINGNNVKSNGVTGTVTVNKEINLLLRGQFESSSKPVCDSVKVSDFNGKCPSDIEVWCVENTVIESSMSYSCVLRKKSDTTCLPESKEKDKNKIYKVKNEEIILDVGKSESKIKCSDYTAVRYIYIIVMIIAPVLAIVFGTLDYTKATMAFDMEKMKKFKKKLPLRILALVLLYITPYFITVILSVFSPNTGYKLMTCITTGKDATVNINSNSQNSSSSSTKSNTSNTKKTTTTKTTTKSTDLNSACNTACKTKYPTSTDLSGCISTCKNGYNSNCQGIADTEGRKNCYKTYANKKVNQNNNTTVESINR